MHDTMTAGLGVLVGGAHDVVGDAGDGGIGPVATAYVVAGMVANPMLAYHGYKRNDDSIGWALGWWFAPIPWPFQAALAYAQGFGTLDKKIAAQRGQQPYGQQLYGQQYSQPAYR